jgi:hypothetical protein
MPVSHSGGPKQEGTIRHERLLIVEGTDDQYLLTALADRLDLALHIHQMEGKDNWPRKMQLLVRSPGFENVRRLALMRDADTDARAAFNSASHALAADQLTPPGQELQFSAGDPAAMIYIMSAASESFGELEDICLDAVSGEVAYECVEDYINCSSNAGRQIPRKASKARLHAYLALAEPPGASFSVAARSNVIPLLSPAFEKARTMLMHLCE